MEKTHSRRIWIGAGVGVGIVIVFLGISALLAWRSLDQARTSLDTARSSITTLESNQHDLLSAAGRARAAQTISRISADAARANSTLRGSFGLHVLGVLPVLSTQRQGLIDLVSDVQQAATTGSGLLDQVNKLVTASHGTTVSLAELQTLQSSVTDARAKLQKLDRSTPGLWGGLGEARAKFNEADATFVTQLGRGQQVLAFALPFLGVNGPRTYLLAAENNAEMRDQGAILSVAVVTARDGQITVGDTRSVSDLSLPAPVSYPIPPGMQQVFGGYQPTKLWQSANATAGFPWSGGDLQAMFAQTTGQHVNGVIAVDVPTVASLLRLTGPITVPGITQPITATNLSDILLHQLYDGYGPDQDEQRHDELSEVARAVVDKLSSENVDLAQVASVLADDIAGRDLIIWDETPRYEATLTKFGASGAVDAGDPSRTFHVAVENATASKLDYYVTTSVSQKVVLHANNQAVVDTTVTVTNNAPAGAKPSLQLGPDNIHSFIPGQYVGNVYLWGPLGTGVTQPGSVVESGLNLSSSVVSVLPQQQATVTFETTIADAVRNGNLSLSYIPQPRLAPEKVSVTLDVQGWQLQGTATHKATLDRTTTLTWVVTKKSR